MKTRSSPRLRSSGLRAVSALLVLSTSGEAAQVVHHAAAHVAEAPQNLRHGALQTHLKAGSPEDALSYLQGRFESVRSEASSLRRQLVEAVSWGRDLQREVAKHKRKEAEEERALKNLEGEEERDDEAALAAEQRKVTTLEGRLTEAQQQVRERDANLASMRSELNGLTTEQQSKESKWRSKEGDFEEEILMLKSKAASVEESVKEIQDAKAAEDAEVISLRNKTRGLVKAQGEAEQLKQREQKYKEMLSQQSSAGAAEVARLAASLKQEKAKEQELADNQKRSRALLSKTEAMAKVALDNTTARLRSALRAKQSLHQENSQLSLELEANASKIKSLEDAISALNKRLQDEQKARTRAEEIAKKSQDALASSQAVAKQLSGAVPQLLEQARLAHEARDAEKAMRTQSQAQAEQQLASLQKQYTNAVRSQLDDIDIAEDSLKTGVVSNSTSGAVDLVVDDKSDDSTSASSSDSSDHGSTDEDDDSAFAQATAGAASALHKLDRDSDGLGSLIAGGDGASEKSGGQGSSSLAHDGSKDS